MTRKNEHSPEFVVAICFASGIIVCAFLLCCLFVIKQCLLKQKKKRRNSKRVSLMTPVYDEIYVNHPDILNIDHTSLVEEDFSIQI